MVRLRHERQPLLRKAGSRQPAGRHHLLWRTWTWLDRGRADRPIVTAPRILCPMTPDRDSRREEIWATLNRLRSSPNESVPLRDAAARHPLDDYGVKPHQHQHLGVDDATMRCLVRDHKGPRCTPVEVLAEVRVWSFCASDAVRTPSEDELPGWLLL
jgi:hypothetical protein